MGTLLGEPVVVWGWILWLVISVGSHVAVMLILTHRAVCIAAFVALTLTSSSPSWAPRGLAPFGISLF